MCLKLHSSFKYFHSIYCYLVYDFAAWEWSRYFVNKLKMQLQYLSIASCKGCNFFSGKEISHLVIFAMPLP